MGNENINYISKYRVWIWVISILIPVVVALLFMIRIPNVAPLSFFLPFTQVLMVLLLYCC